MDENIVEVRIPIFDDDGQKTGKHRTFTIGRHIAEEQIRLWKEWKTKSKEEKKDQSPPLTAWKFAEIVEPTPEPVLEKEPEQNLQPAPEKTAQPQAPGKPQQPPPANPPA